MEKEEKAALNRRKWPAGKLNLNAPLLSTRRTIGVNRLEDVQNANSVRVSWDKFERIPFSWEQTPGKPKERGEESDGENAEEIIPPPKPPPGCRWLPAEEEADPKRDSCEGEAERGHDYDDGCEGDVEDDGGVGAHEDWKGGDGVSSNELDIFSLAQSVETVDTWKELRRKFGIGNGDMEEGIGCHSPSFMIQRFLPDAKALAAAASSSSTSLNKALINSDDEKRKKHPNSSSGAGRRRASGAIRTATHSWSYSSWKGCGLDILLPWRMKPRPCGCGVKGGPAMAALATSRPQWSGSSRK